MTSFVVLVHPNSQQSEKVKTLMEGTSESECKGDTTKLKEQFNAWTCNRCRICIACGKNRPYDGRLNVKVADNAFVTCFYCKDAYHPACLGKRYEDGFVEDFSNPATDETALASTSETQWICENCAKCRSCGIKLVVNCQDKKSSKKKNNLMLCMECFRRRQRGSYCPVCNVTYDDNDYDTRMMECGNCERWIHAKCEGISEEQYQVLSHLPECIEFTCKLCDKTGNPLWRQAVNMEIINGCESVLRLFTKKALSESRKRRALNFDNMELPINSLHAKRTFCEQNDEDLLEIKQLKLEPVVSENVVTPSFQNIPCVCSSSAQTPAAVPMRLSDSDGNSNSQHIPSKGNDAIPSRTIKPSKRLAAVQGRTRYSSGKKAKQQRPLEMYEISDGSFVSIKECKIFVQDLLAFPTEESSKYLRSNKGPAPSDNSESSSVVPENGMSDNSMNPKLTSDNFDFKVLNALDIDLRVARDRKIELTPKKNTHAAHQTPRNPIVTTPILVCTPSKKVACFIDLVKSRLAKSSFMSVMYFRDFSLEILEEYFEDVEQIRRVKLRDYFKVAVHDVFPWFDEQILVNSDLPKLQPNKHLSTFSDSLINSKDSGNVTVISDTNITLLDSNPFRDTYWEDMNTSDCRICSFCGNVGDLPSDGCGRLLWAGLNEWIHINCALWSCEVWEEESGALQQVGQALSRSRNLTCAFCGKKGASVSCCHQHCRSSFHFPCAIKANCSLNLDKSTFCVKHSGNCKQSLIQHEYQVLRKVFVDWEWLKRKEKPVCSSQVKVFIGSLKVDTLGHLIPISVVTPFQSQAKREPNVVCKQENQETAVDSTATALAPDQYCCTRLYWSSSNPLDKISYQISGSVEKDWFRSFVKRKSCNDFNIVIDHSEPWEVIVENVSLMNSFHNWLLMAPKLVDEYSVEWLPSCPFPAPFNETGFVETKAKVGSGDGDRDLNLKMEEDEYQILARATSFGSHSNCSKNELNQISCPQVSTNSLVSEPFSFRDYMILYERIRDFNKILEEDIRCFSSEEDSEVDVLFDSDSSGVEFPNNTCKTMNSVVHTGVAEDNCMKQFIEKLERRRSGNTMESKKLMYCMLDGAVNDSSSDASFSSSSSTSSSPASAVNSDDENEELDLSTESSTASSDEDEDSSEPRTSSSSQRVTRNQTSSKKGDESGKKSPNKTTTVGRQLRSRKSGKSEAKKDKKMEKEKKIQCPSCRKAFQSQASVNRHSRWCKPKKLSPASAKRTSSTSTTESTTSSCSTDPATLSGSSSSVVSLKRARGRPPKNINIPPKDSTGKSGAKQGSLSGSRSQGTQRHRKVIHSDEESESMERSDSENSEESPSLRHPKVVLQLQQSELEPQSSFPSGGDLLDNVGISKDMDADDQPKTCDKCKLTYRTLASFNKHLPQCISYTSSSGSDDEHVKGENTEHCQQRDLTANTESSKISEISGATQKEGSQSGICSDQRDDNLPGPDFVNDDTTESSSPSPSLGSPVSTTKPTPDPQLNSELCELNDTYPYVDSGSSSNLSDSVQEESGFAGGVSLVENIMNSDNVPERMEEEALNQRTFMFQAPPRQDPVMDNVTSAPDRFQTPVSSYQHESLTSCAVTSRPKSNSERISGSGKGDEGLLSCDPGALPSPREYSLTAQSASAPFLPHSHSPNFSSTSDRVEPTVSSVMEHNFPAHVSVSNISKPTLGNGHVYRNETGCPSSVNAISQSFSHVSANTTVILPSRSSDLQSSTFLPRPLDPYLTNTHNSSAGVRVTNMCPTSSTPDLIPFCNSQVQKVERDRVGLNILPSERGPVTYVTGNNAQSGSVVDMQSNDPYGVEIVPSFHLPQIPPQTERTSFLQSYRVPEMGMENQPTQLQLPCLNPNQGTGYQVSAAPQSQTDIFPPVIPGEQTPMSNNHMQQLQQQILFHQQLQLQNQFQAQQLSVSQHQPAQYQPAQTSQLGYCHPSPETNHYSQAANCASLPQSLPQNLASLNASHPPNAAEAGSNNMAYIVVQHGNTISTIPLNQQVPSQSFQPMSSSLQPVHPNLNLTEQVNCQNQHVNLQNMFMSSSMLPSTNPCPTVILNYIPGEHQLPLSPITRDTCNTHNQPQSFLSPSTQSCACTAFHSQDGSPTKKIQGDKKLTRQVSSHPCASAHINKRSGRHPLNPVRTQVPGIIPMQPISIRSSEDIFPRSLPMESTPPKRNDTSSAAKNTILIPSPTASDTLAPVVSVAGKVPISSPNIAVVRPMMEHPLQKISHQISQLEAHFNSPLSTGGLSSTSNDSEHSTESLESSSSSGSASTPIAERDCSIADSMNGSELITLSSMASRPGGENYGKVTHNRGVVIVDPLSVSTVASSSSAVKGVRQLYPRPFEEPIKVSSSMIWNSNLPVAPATQASRPRMDASKSADTQGKSIKVTLKRKEGGDSYSINDVKETGLEAAGAMRSLKIKGKITSGEQAGTATDVVVVPVIRTIPIVAESRDADGQSEIIRYDEKEGLVCSVRQSDVASTEGLTDHNKSFSLTNDGLGKNPVRLTHRAVIVYEVKCNNRVLFRSSDVRAVWGHIFETVQGTRLKHDLPPLAYPATNISLPENQREAAASFNMLGLTHQAVQFLLEQLPGTNSVMQKHRFRFHEPNLEDALLPGNRSGCARTEGFISRKPFDMFGWLASKHRNIPAKIETPSDWARQDLPIAMKYRNLREKSPNELGVFYSAIHGRGLFTRRDIQEGEIIIEYAGELIRTILSDRREKYYESKGIGCYFFTIDQNVIIDATLKGNAARFINHSCEPNCRSKAVEILGKKHILIFAERKIHGGEELTYDYKFALEDYDKKIPCTCGAKKCRKYLN